MATYSDTKAARDNAIRLLTEAEKVIKHGYTGSTLASALTDIAEVYARIYAAEAD